MSSNASRLALAAVPGLAVLSTRYLEGLGLGQFDAAALQFADADDAQGFAGQRKHEAEYMLRHGGGAVAAHVGGGDADVAQGMGRGRLSGAQRGVVADHHMGLRDARRDVVGAAELMESPFVTGLLQAADVQAVAQRRLGPATRRAAAYRRRLWLGALRALAADGVGEAMAQVGEDRRYTEDAA